MNTAEKSVAIIQPAYIPWKGFFDFIAYVDEFLVFDDVDYIKRNWYSRNCVKQASGDTKWLSIPVEYSQSNPTAINRTPIKTGFAQSHLDFIKAQYQKAPYFDEYFTKFSELLKELEQRQFLSEVTVPIILWLVKELRITTPIHYASEFQASGKASQRLLDLCQKRGATHYVSGPAAQSYLQEEIFTAQGISVEWMDYSGYPEYPQLYPPFSHAVSVLDLLFMTGQDAPNHMKHIPRSNAQLTKAQA